MHPQKPARPVPGDTLGIIAPSSPFDKDKFQKGLGFIKDLGFRVFFSETVFEQKKYLAGTDAIRARALNAMFADSNIKAIICARGGYGSLRLLSLIDFDQIAQNPKLLIGCSDITVLLNSLLTRCKLASLHGPMIESLANASEPTRQAFSDILLTDQNVSIPSAGPATIHSGRASGKLAGGNLTTLCHLVGTPFAPDFSGHILLLEDIGESPYRIDRMVTQMKMAGCFEKINGIVLGTFKDCGNVADIYQIFYDNFAKNSIPVLAGFSIGHDEPNLSVPFGIRATLDTDIGLLSFSESLFS